MRKDFKSSTSIAPLPVLVVSAFNKDEAINVMTIAWGGVYNSNQVIICVSKEHLTTKYIEESKAFVLSYVDSNHVAEADYFGLISGTKEDKIKKVNFHFSKSKNVFAPIIDELPIAVECSLNKLIEIDEDMYGIIGDVKNISVDESLINENGKVDLDLANLVSYDTFTHTYRLVSNVVAKAYEVGNKYLK